MGARGGERGEARGGELGGERGRGVALPDFRDQTEGTIFREFRALGEAFVKVAPAARPVHIVTVPTVPTASSTTPAPTAITALWAIHDAIHDGGAFPDVNVKVAL